MNLESAPSTNTAPQGQTSQTPGHFNPSGAPAPQQGVGHAQPAQPNQTTPQETKPPDDYAVRFSRLLERERRLQEQAVKYKPQLELADKYSQIQKVIGEGDPLAAIEMLGLSYDDLTTRALARKDLPPEVEKALSKVKQIETQLSEREKQDRDSQTQRQIEHQKGVLANAIESSEYELVKAAGAVDHVWELMVQHYNATIDPETGLGEVLSWEKAAESVENEISETVKKFSQTKKFASLIGQAPSAPSTPQSADQALFKPSASEPNTLSNNAVRAGSVNESSSVMDSEEELIRKAAALIKFT